MADLESLIKVRKHDVEEKQKFLANLYRQLEAMNSSKESILKSLEEEANATEEIATAEAYAYFGRYNTLMRDKIKQIEQEMKKLETRIDIARENMRSAFAEMKKVEIVHETRQKEQAKELLKKENIEMDEIGIDGFRRGEEEQ